MIRYSLSIVSTLVVLSLVLLFYTVSFSPPSIPNTPLQGSAIRTYYTTMKSIARGRGSEPVRIRFSPGEISTLVEHFTPRLNRFGFALADAHISSVKRGRQARVQGLFEGPLGLFLLIDFTGVLEVKKRTWHVSIDALSLGRLPVHWMLPERMKLSWPTTFREGSITVVQGRLDGDGLRARIRLDSPRLRSARSSGSSQ